jgi:hypothetical protein
LSSKQDLDIWSEEGHENEAREQDQCADDDAFLAENCDHMTVEKSAKECTDPRGVAETSLPGRGKLVA